MKFYLKFTKNKKNEIRVYNILLFIVDHQKNDPVLFQLKPTHSFNK